MQILLDDSGAVSQESGSAQEKVCVLVDSNFTVASADFFPGEQVTSTEKAFVCAIMCILSFVLGLLGGTLKGLFSRA
jgi:hypothetical protein